MAAYKKSEEMRESILTASKHLFLENGYQKTTIKDIADYLQVPRSLVYYYFDSKQSIMTVLYQDCFGRVDELASTVLPRGEEPMVRLVLKYLLHRRMLLLNPLFKEFIIESEFAAQNLRETNEQIQRYYSDSRAAFAYFGMSVDGDEFLVHVHMLEGVARALIIAEYFGTLEITERQAMDYLGKYAIMPTFSLTRLEYTTILQKALSLLEGLEVC